MRQIRGNRISMIFQEPMTSLNPVLTVGRQIAETVQLHQKASRADAMKRAVEMLRVVQIPEPERRVNEYPHQLSGGMRQRVMIALALACNPEVLIADEPTTALDVTIQAQILDLIKRLQKELGMGVVMITHDLGVVAESCDRVVVMYAGKKVEEARRDRPVRPPAAPLHARADGLDARDEHREHAAHRDPGAGAGRTRTGARLRLCGALQPCARTLPRRDAAARAAGRRPCGGVLCSRRTLGRYRGDGCMTTTAATPLLQVRNLRKHYISPKRWLRPARPSIQAVDGVSFSVARGETLSLVGESGCGKTTTAKSVMRLVEPTSGSVELEGEELADAVRRGHAHAPAAAADHFQDPYASLNPRLTAGDIVAEPLRNFGMSTAAERRERVQWLFSRVGLRPEAAKKFPHEFSGGQRQRLGIARALALNPKLIVCDEPVSALDVSVQAQVVNLLMDLQAEFGIAYLFVAHDLAVVRHISHRVAVMYLGHIVEVADRDTLFSAPLHPYTEILLSAVPVPNPRTPRTPHAAAGRSAEPRQPAFGLPLSHALPDGAGRLQGDRRPTLSERPSSANGSHWVACHFR